MDLCVQQAIKIVTCIHLHAYVLCKNMHIPFLHDNISLRLHCAEILLQRTV